MIFGAEQLCQKMALEKCVLIFAKPAFFNFLLCACGVCPACAKFFLRILISHNS